MERVRRQTQSDLRRLSFEHREIVFGTTPSNTALSISGHKEEGGVGGESVSFNSDPN